MNVSGLKSLLAIIFVTCIPAFCHAQEDPWAQLDETSDEYVMATFKGTRLVNFQTIEVLGKRTLDFRISHRFGEFGSGSYNYYGIDGPANIRLGLEYSYDGRLMAGFGRSSFEKQYDGFLKYRLLRQKESKGMPVSVTLFTSVYATRLKDPNKASTGFDKYKYFADRLSYVHQIIIARKLTPALSVQVAPTMVHYNLAEGFYYKNDTYQVAVAARFKITPRFALTMEYAYNLIEQSKTAKFYDPLGIGFDIETGGHVFQVFLTNAFGIADNQVYPYTTSSWKNKGFRIGFNVSRVFTL